MPVGRIPSNLEAAAAALVLLTSLTACSPPEAPAPPPPPAPVAKPPAPPAPLAFIEDDLPRATARAVQEKKAVFVDVWAPWCHTCLSMKSYVLSSPELAPLADLAVFASIDFDKPDSAAFVEKYKVKGLPSFLVVDATSGELLGTWVGSGSVREMKSMVEIAASTSIPGGPARGPRGAFRAGCQARQSGRHVEAAAAFESAFQLGGAAFPLRQEALLGWLDELGQGGDSAGCAAVAIAHERDLSGSSVPSDAAITVLMASSKLDGEPKARARAFAKRVLTQFVDHPPEGASVDDRGDASASLADALAEDGDAAGAKAVREAWLGMLEKATREAPSLPAAHVFDYQRSNALVALGRVDEAIRIFEERVKELPDDYEPMGRLASAYMKANRYGDALPAIRKAIALSYGPRRLRYMSVEAQILGAVGDHAGEVEVLEREVTGWDALPPGQSSAANVADAKQRLQAAKAGAKRKR